MPRQQPLRASLPLLSTPFDPSGDALDLAALTSNLRAHVAAGLDGIVVAGSTGEATLLTESERSAMLETARAAVPRDRLLVAGIGAESTSLTIDRARNAGAIGVDAVLVVAPHYYPQSATPDALVRHYTRIADASPVPVLLYNIPQYMHYNLPPAAVQQLAQHANIIGMKDSSGDLGVLGGYLKAQSPKFSVLTGNASTFHAALTAGVRGGILAVAVFVPGLVLALFEAARAGRSNDAAAFRHSSSRSAARSWRHIGRPASRRQRTPSDSRVDLRARRCSPSIVRRASVSALRAGAAAKYRLEWSDAGGPINRRRM